MVIGQTTLAWLIAMLMYQIAFATQLQWHAVWLIVVGILALGALLIQKLALRGRGRARSD